MSAAQPVLRFATLALQVSQAALPPFAHRFAPKRFRLPQLAACVLLKEYLRCDWRGIETFLELCPALRRCLGLRRVPDFSTLHKFSARWLSPPCLQRLLDALLSRLGIENAEVAMDSTGLNPDRTSSYYASRRRLRPARKRYVKVSLAVVVGALVASGLVVDWGPCNDKTELPSLLEQTQQRLPTWRWLYADAGYDAEWVHVRCREQLGVTSWIPPAVHRADGSVGGRWRSRMARGLPRRYGRRWAAESFISGMKRKLGADLSGRGKAAQLRQAALKVIAYSIHR